MLEFIFGTAGVLFDACRLQEPNMEGSSRHSEPEALFSSILGSAPRCSGRFSLQRELCFHLDDEWQKHVDVWLHFGVIVGAKSSTILTVLPESILGGKWGVVLKVTFCVFPGE